MLYKHKLKTNKHSGGYQMKRRQSREQAFMLVFERSFRDESIEEIIEQATDGRNIVVDDFAKNLAKETCDRLISIDDIIQKYSTKWKLNRLPRVTLAILRLSVCEIDNVDEVPISVSINEAVELAKKFSTEDDASYINGVLGAYVRERYPDKE